MSDPLLRAEPVPTAPYVAHGIMIRLAPPMMRYSLRARQAQALETLLKVKLPKSIGGVEGDIACLGPDEWLLRSETALPNTVGAGVLAAITDVSERSVCLIVEGPGAARLLMAGCPLDLDKFPVGHAARTLFETVEIILIRDSADCYHVEVWRSFADWLWTALTTASSH